MFDTYGKLLGWSLTIIGHCPSATRRIASSQCSKYNYPPYDVGGDYLVGRAVCDLSFDRAEVTIFPLPTSLLWSLADHRYAGITHSA